MTEVTAFLYRDTFSGLTWEEGDDWFRDDMNHSFLGAYYFCSVLPSYKKHTVYTV
jgi:hypothetical protein